MQSGSNVAAAANIGESKGPQRVLGTWDAIALIVGIVVGAGIFSFPSLVAANSASSTAFLAVWVLGGVISLIGALCYAELASTFPNAGGDYYFVKRAYGDKLAFLFGWSRVTVTQTGSAAILAYVFGDYASQFYSFGEFSPMIYAALLIILLTSINIIGIKMGTGTQKLLTALQVTGVFVVIGAGLLFAPSEAANTAPATQTNLFGLTMVFVLLTFGGWNEAAYISAEMKKGGKQIAHGLIFGILAITTLYILINFAYLNVLGLGGMAASNAIAGDVIRLTLGNEAAWLIGLIVVLAALTSANATIFTGARTNYALGRDFKALKFLGKWNDRSDSPTNALIIQALIALALIGFSAWTRDGLQAVIDYTAPIFWFFFLLTGISVFILRRKEPDVDRPFRIPFYPIPPIIFCLTSAYLLYSSVTYTGTGSLVGLAVLAAGGLVLIGISIFSASDKGDKLEDR